MSTYTDKFFADKAVGALWDVAVSIKRGNPLPLDKDSVVHGLTELNAIATGSVSYPGQIIAVVEDAVYEGEGEDKVLVTEESVTLYYLDHNKTPREVGKVPTGDSKTIEVSSEGAISLLGSASAEDGTLPMLENGVLVWKTLEDIGAGDGNDNTTYVFTTLTRTIGEGEDAKEEVYGFKVETLFNGQPAKDAEGNLIPAQEFDFGYTKSEIEGLVNAEKERALAAEKALDDKIGAAAGDSEAATGIYAELEKKVDKTTYATDKKALEDEDAAVRAIAEEAKTLIDDFLTGSDTDEVVNKLKEIQAELDKLGDVVDLEAALALKADLQYVNEELAKKQDTIPENTYDAYGSAATAKSEAISAAAADATSKADTAKAEAIADAAGKYATKEYVGNIPEGYDETNVIAYVNKKAQEVLDSATGGSSESAASVKQQLDTYKAANDPKVKALLEEVWGSETYTGDSRIDTLETGVASAIKDVKAATNAKITVSVDTDKVATIDDAALQALITEAKKAGTDANSALETYKGTNDAAVDKVRTDLAAEAGKLATLTETVNGHTTSITEHSTKLGALEGTVAGHTTSITELSGNVAKKADQSSLDDAISRISVNEDAIKALNDTTIPGINNKFNDYYTKTEVGTIEEGKTLVEMIAAAGDKSAIEGRVKAIEDDYLKAADKNELASLINDHEIRITEMEEFFTAADNKDETIENLAEIIAYINSDKSGATEMAGNIQKNANDIATLTKTVGDNKTAADEAIAAITDNYKVKDVDNTSLALDENGVASIKKVSTDLLENGSQELIFKAGNASGYNTEATE